MHPQKITLISKKIEVFCESQVMRQESTVYRNEVGQKPVYGSQSGETEPRGISGDR